MDRVQNAYGYDFFAVVDALGEKIASLTKEGQRSCNLVAHGMETSPDFPDFRDFHDFAFSTFFYDDHVITDQIGELSADNIFT